MHPTKEMGCVSLWRLNRILRMLRGTGGHVTNRKLGPMTDPAAIRVLIVDDHPVVRFGLGAIIRLQPDMDVMGEAGSGEEACRMCLDEPPDVVLMDLRLPGLSGVQAIKTIRETAPSVRFIVLTTYDGDEDIRRALDAGAQAYLLKAMSHDDVTAAIRKVHSGARVIPQRCPEPSPTARRTRR